MITQHYDEEGHFVQIFFSDRVTEKMVSKILSGEIKDGDHAAEEIMKKALIGTYIRDGK